jgi:hypothetical protein
MKKLSGIRMATFYTGSTISVELSKVIIDNSREFLDSSVVVVRIFIESFITCSYTNLILGASQLNYDSVVLPFTWCGLRFYDPQHHGD